MLLANALKLCVGVEIVERLWKEACHVDGIGRGKLHVLVKLVVHECLLYKSLTVVEHTVYFNGCDVLSECGELALLNLADLALRIEHIYMDAFNAKKTIGYSRTRVATCSYEHIYILSSLFAYEVLQHTRHEACAYILKCKCWSVEEFERVYILFDFLYWAVERQGVVDDALEVVCLDVFAEEGICHLVCYLLKRELVDVLKKILRQFLDMFGHIETAVGSKSFYYCLVQRGEGCCMVGAVIFHRI